MKDLKGLLQGALDMITVENWSKAVKHAENLQHEDAKMDIARDTYIDSFIIVLDSSDDEDDFS